MIDLESVCAWQLGDSVCIRDPWHDAAHHMVSIHELEAA